jgi:hypothetical protein
MEKIHVRVENSWRENDTCTCCTACSNFVSTAVTANLDRGRARSQDIMIAAKTDSSTILDEIGVVAVAVAGLAAAAAERYPRSRKTLVERSNCRSAVRSTSTLQSCWHNQMALIVVTWLARRLPYHASGATQGHVGHRRSNAELLCAGPIVTARGCLTHCWHRWHHCSHHWHCYHDSKSMQAASSEACA